MDKDRFKRKPAQDYRYPVRPARTVIGGQPVPPSQPVPPTQSAQPQTQPASPLTTPQNVQSQIKMPVPVPAQAMPQAPTPIPVLDSEPQFQKPDPISPTTPTEPQFTAPKPYNKRSRKLFLPAIIGAGLLIVIIGATGTYLLLKPAPKSKPVSYVSPNTLGVTNADKPQFKPVAPVSEPELAKGGKGAAYDKLNKTYAYIDTYNGVKLAVSQQGKPAGYATGQTVATKLAASLVSSSSFATSYGTAYIVTKADSPAQMVITPVNSLLVVISSPSTLTNEQWQSYINSLR